MIDGERTLLEDAHRTQALIPGLGPMASARPTPFSRTPFSVTGAAAVLMDQDDALGVGGVALL